MKWMDIIKICYQNPGHHRGQTIRTCAVPPCVYFHMMNMMVLTTWYTQHLTPYIQHVCRVWIKGLQSCYQSADSYHHTQLSKLVYPVVYDLWTCCRQQYTRYGEPLWDKDTLEFKSLSSLTNKYNWESLRISVRVSRCWLYLHPEALKHKQRPMHSIYADISGVLWLQWLL